MVRFWGCGAGFVTASLVLMVGACVGVTTVRIRWRSDR